MLQSYCQFFGQHLGQNPVNQIPKPAATKASQQGTEPQEYPYRRPHERSLGFVVHKEQQAHAQGKQSHKKKSKEPVKKGGRKPRTHGILAAFHADIINLLDIAAHIARHKVVKEQSHVIKFQQVAVL